MSVIHPDFLAETARRIELAHYPDTRQFVVQHLYPDTLRLLLLLHEHVPIHCVIGIGYSGDSDVVAKLELEGIRVCTPQFDDLHGTVQEELNNTLAYCEENQLRLVIHEVGGYAVKSLHTHFDNKIHLVVGALEITKQGVWVAQELPELKLPQLNCAQTRLKEVEGKMVGEAVVAAFDNILRELGYAMVGRQALVTGFGWVGAGTAQSLRKRGMNAVVFDTDVLKLVDAAVEGFAVCRSTDALQPPAMVIGVSGRQSITKAVIDQLPHKCFLVSGASKDHEIDLAYLNEQTTSVESIHRFVDAHTLGDGRVLLLVNKGYPVNFTGSSVPDEIVEFLFAELIILMQELLESTPPPGVYPLNEEREKIAAEVWLDLR